MFNFQNKDENIITNETMKENRYLYSLYVYETSRLLYCAGLKTNGKKKTQKKSTKLRNVRTMKYCNRNTRCNQPPRKRKQISFSHIYIYIIL